MNPILKENTSFSQKGFYGKKRSLIPMKSAFILLLAGALNTSAYGETTVFTPVPYVTVKANGMTVRDVLKIVEEQSSYYFTYKSGQIDTERIVSINIKNRPVNDLLDKLFRGEDISYKIENKHIVLYKKDKNVAPVVTQKEKVVTGTITDHQGMPIIGANVAVKGTTNGTITDLDGKFTLKIPENSTLEISYIGFLTESVRVGHQDNLTITMREDTQKLDEVVVVGYGTQKKKDLTSSIAKVGGDEIAHLTSASFDTQLAGRAAGVQVSTPSGVLGSTPQFKIRGMSTISSSSQPLFIIDGMPINGGANGEGNNEKGLGKGSVTFNALSDINPNDIASIEILKDGAASAIYGSRAANGVVLITTKKGSRGRTQVNYDGYVSAASPTKLHDLLNAKDFVMIANEKYENHGDKGQAVYDPNGPDTNWNDYIYRTGFQHSHNISASGGTEKSQYYASLGYTNQTGIVRSNDLERFNLKADLTQQATKWLRIGISGQMSRTSIHGFSNTENSLQSVGFGVFMLPNVAVYNPEHPTGYNIDPERFSLGRGSNLSVIDNGLSNIVWVLDNNINKSTNTRALGNGWAEITFMDGLTLRTQGGMDISNVNDYSYQDAASGEGHGVGGRIFEYYSQYETWNWQNMLNFIRTFNDTHNLTVTAVQEYTHETQAWTMAEVSQLSDSFFKEHIISNTFDQKDVQGYKSSNGLASYMVRANYNYDSKYYIGASIRWDGLSRLPENNRWGTFWGVSGAYRISREKFWSESPINNWFNDLRFRASYATIGNSQLGSDFPYLGTYEGILYGPYSGIAWKQMGNNHLKWETTETFDIGIDGALLNNRLTFELAYWQKNSKDLVLQVPTAPTMGVPYNSYYDNIGRIKNSGFELTLNATVISTKDWNWQTSFNFSTVKNTVQELYGGNDIVDNYTIIREGESYKSLYGYDYYGVNPVNGNPIWKKADGNLVQFDTFGSYNYAVYDPNNPSDVSQASSLTADDRKILGSSMPTWYGGWSNTVSFRNFDLNVFFRFSGGNKIMNQSRSMLLNTNFYNNGTEILNRWVSPEQPGDGITPRIGYGDDSKIFNSGYTDSHFVESGNFLKLSNVTIGYTLPQSVISKLKMTKIRFYLQGQNLFTITPYSGLDPETSTRLGVDWGGMPQQRSFTLGANITF